MKLTMLSLILALSMALANGVKDQGCDSFTLENCTPADACPEKKVGNIESLDVCQATCHLIFPDVCKSVVYYAEDQSCAMYDCPLQDWVPSCGGYGGTPLPDFSNCQTPGEDSCESFRDYSCQYIGDEIQVQALETVEECQVLCSTLDHEQCHFFVFKHKTCHLYKTSERTCSGIAAPPSPSVVDC